MCSKRRIVTHAMLGLLIAAGAGSGSAGCLPETRSQAAGKKQRSTPTPNVSKLRSAGPSLPGAHSAHSAPVHLAAVRSSFLSSRSERVRRAALRYPKPAEGDVQQAPISVPRDGLPIRLTPLR